MSRLTSLSARRSLNDSGGDVKKVLVSRYGAYGDAIFISHLPRLLKDQGFDQVDFDVNFKVMQVLWHNPFIDNFRFFEPPVGAVGKDLITRWEEISKGYDKFINLFGSLEYGCITMEDDSFYAKSDEERRSEFGKINFYDQTTAWAGYPELCGKYKPEIYFAPDEVVITEKWLEQFDGKFIVMIGVSGSSRHKEFVQAKEVSARILSKYPDAVVILTGGKNEEKYSFDGDRIVSIIGKKPFMQAALITKYVDAVICMETGLGVAANVWGTPTIFLLTSSNPINVCRYADNSLAIQSPAKCSPCHRGPYKYELCEKKDGRPVCVYFDVNEIMEKVAVAYAARKKCALI